MFPTQWVAQTVVTCTHHVFKEAVIIAVVWLFAYKSLNRDVLKCIARVSNANAYFDICLANRTTNAFGHRYRIQLAACSLQTREIDEIQHERSEIWSISPSETRRYRFIRFEESKRERFPLRGHCISPNRVLSKAAANLECLVKVA